TRSNEACTAPEPLGTTTMPDALLSATRVLDTARLLEPFGWNRIPLPTPLPLRFRMAQFSTVRDPPLLNTMPFPPPKPIPLMARPRRLAASLGLALMVIPPRPPDTSTPASPTPSLMMLIVLLMASAP